MKDDMTVDLDFVGAFFWGLLIILLPNIAQAQDTPTQTQISLERREQACRSFSIVRREHLLREPLRDRYFDRVLDAFRGEGPHLSPVLAHAISLVKPAAVITAQDLNSYLSVLMGVPIANIHRIALSMRYATFDEFLYATGIFGDFLRSTSLNPYQVNGGLVAVRARFRPSLRSAGSLGLMAIVSMPSGGSRFEAYLEEPVNYFYRTNEEVCRMIQMDARVEAQIISLYQLIYVVPSRFSAIQRQSEIRIHE